MDNLVNIMTMPKVRPGFVGVVRTIDYVQTGKIAKLTSGVFIIDHNNPANIDRVIINRKGELFNEPAIIFDDRAITFSELTAAGELTEFKFKDGQTLSFFELRRGMMLGLLDKALKCTMVAQITDDAYAYKFEEI